MSFMIMVAKQCLCNCLHSSCTMILASSRLMLLNDMMFEQTPTIKEDAKTMKGYMVTSPAVGVPG